MERIQGEIEPIIQKLVTVYASVWIFWLVPNVQLQLHLTCRVFARKWDKNDRKGQETIEKVGKTSSIESDLRLITLRN